MGIASGTIGGSPSPSRARLRIAPWRIPYYRIDSQHRVLSDPRWHLHHNAVLRIRIADLNLDLLRSKIFGSIIWVLAKPSSVRQGLPVGPVWRRFTSVDVGKTLPEDGRRLCADTWPPSDASTIDPKKTAQNLAWQGIFACMVCNRLPFAPCCPLGGSPSPTPTEFCTKILFAACVALKE